MNNIILETDSYKFGGHWNMYPENTQNVYSYFECRNGARWPTAVFFGLQYILKRHLAGQVVTREKIEQAARLSKAHLGTEDAFYRAGWEYILEKHNGYLPIRIKAVPEGTVVPVSNALITIEATDENPLCGWLANYIEGILSRIWYPITVATLSYETKALIKYYLERTATSVEGLNFMLHDFGYRSATVEEAAGIGGAAHLVNFLGTDTIAAIETIDTYYGSNDFEGIAFSVPASEHSIMTSLGPDGEAEIVQRLLDKYPKGILSVVADSYDIYNFVSNFVGEKFKDQILARDGVFVVRPDSVTPRHPQPELEMVWIVEELFNKVGGTKNAKGYKVINPKVRVLWGDGIDKDGIKKILDALMDAGYSAENVATFGMGSGLCQKGQHRDVMRCAFKSSAQKRDGQWFNIQKNPLDISKKSKAGRLKLVRDGNTFATVQESDPRPDELVTVFENGQIVKTYTFSEIRERAAKG